MEERRRSAFDEPQLASIPNRFRILSGMWGTFGKGRSHRTQYVTQKFANTREGLTHKDQYSRELAAQGFRIVSEQVEAGTYKGDEQCCLFLICAPCAFLAGRTPGFIVVTYGRELGFCPNCGTQVSAGTQCGNCLRIAAAAQQRAIELAAEARDATARLGILLGAATNSDYRFDWQSLIEPFSVPEPTAEPKLPVLFPPRIVRIARTFPFLDRRIPWLRTRRLRWEEFLDADARARTLAAERHNRALDEWKESKAAFEREQIARVEGERRRYLSRDVIALQEYWGRIATRPILGMPAKPVRSLIYSEAERKLILTYAMPGVEQLPGVIATNELHRDLIIKIALVVLYRLFQSDVADALNAVAVNGTIDAVDRGSGHDLSPCIIAVQSDKTTLLGMNFSRIDAVACLQRLGGRVSGNLSGFEPVAPIAD